MKLAILILLLVLFHPACKSTGDNVSTLSRDIISGGCEIYAADGFKLRIATLLGQDQITMFNPTFSDQARSATVGPGCSLEVYKDRNFYGESTIYTGVSTISSLPYGKSLKCICNSAIFANEFLKPLKLPQNPFYAGCYENCTYAVVPNGVYGNITAFTEEPFWADEDGSKGYTGRDSQPHLEAPWAYNIESLTVRDGCIATLYDEPNYSGNKLGSFEGGRTHILNQFLKNKTVSYRLNCDDSYSTSCPSGSKRTDLLCQPIWCENFHMSLYETVTVKTKGGQITYRCEDDKTVYKKLVCDDPNSVIVNELECLPPTATCTTPRPNPAPGCQVDCICGPDQTNCRWKVCGCPGAPECD